ncbi:MAG: preprotein translocase subunit SecE [Oscillospiraceae bacterium]|nr:preprotein translocase subunit SecE [Oscillospiraceae bacterium]MBR6209458.1 preprotein translocase subunit SecE [Oscillospiraceae bacterium]
MANEEKKTAVPAQAKGGAVKRTNDKPGFMQRVKKWFREMKSELKKVVWPTRQQITKNTAVALVMMFASAIVLWGFDSLASAGIKALITLVG